MIGGTLAHYRVTSKLGEGGMGEVYQATDTKLGREVAIKVLPSLFTRDAERLARFEREARVLASLNHPNIAAIYSFESAVPTDAPGRHGGRPLQSESAAPVQPEGADDEAVSFLVMELATGSTMADRLTAGPMPLDDVLPIARQIIDALEAAHEKGIIHRDLKPANIKIDDGGKVKVLDFGLAKALDTAAASGGSADASQPSLSMSPTLTAQMTGANVVLGTAAYMSPEQAKGKSVDKQSDIWAFGVVLWEMLTGKRLFQGDSVTEILADVLRSDIDLERAAGAMPTPLAEVLRRCLERDPDRRLHDIADARLVLEDLERDGWEVEPPPASRKVWGSRLALAFAAIVGLVAGGFVMWAAGRSEPKSTSRPWTFEIPIPEAVTSMPALSPDGRQIAYSSEGQLWVRDLNRLEPRAVTGADGGASSFWSPDGRSLGFDADGAMWRVPVEGGSRQLLSNHSLSTAGEAVWLPDDRILFVPGNTGILEVAARGGETRSVIEPLPGEVDFHRLVVLPDDRGYLTVIHESEDQAFDNVTLIRDQERTELVRFAGDYIYDVAYSETGHILFTVEGAHGRRGLWAVDFLLDTLSVVGEPFLVTRSAVFPSVVGSTLVYAPHHEVFVNEMVWVDRQGKVTQTLWEPQEGLYPTVALSPDGGRVVFPILGREGGSLWMLELDSGVGKRFVFEQDAYVGFPSWGSQSDRIVYGASRGGHDLRLMIVNPDSGVDAEVLTEGHIFSDVSPDGRYLLFTRPRPGYQNDLWWRDFESGEESVYMQTDEWDIQPAFAPDGRMVAYRSGDEIFVASFPDGESRWQISDDGGWSPQWSADGRHLYFFDDDAFMEVAIDSGPPLRASRPTRLFFFRQAPAELQFSRSFAVDGNGERFLMVRVAGIPPGIVVQHDWLAGIRE